MYIYVHESIVIVTIPVIPSIISSAVFTRSILLSRHYRTARKCEVYCSKRALCSGVAFASTFGYNLFLLDTYSQCQLCVLRPLLALPLEGRGRIYNTVRDLSSPCQMRLAVDHTTQSAHMVIVHTESGLSFCTKRRLSRSESMKAVKLRT